MVGTPIGQSGRRARKLAIMEYKTEVETVPTRHPGTVVTTVRGWAHHTNHSSVKSNSAGVRIRGLNYSFQGCVGFEEKFWDQFLLERGLRPISKADV